MRNSHCTFRFLQTENMAFDFKIPFQECAQMCSKVKTAACRCDKEKYVMLQFTENVKAIFNLFHSPTCFASFILPQSKPFLHSKQNKRQ